LAKARTASTPPEVTSARSRLAALVTLLQAIFSDAKVIRKFGDVPDDLSGL
jgi:hypothetical protein